MKTSVGFILYENVMRQDKHVSFLVYLFQHIFHPKASPGSKFLSSSLTARIFKWRSCFMISIVLTTTKSDLNEFFLCIACVKCARRTSVKDLSMWRSKDVFLKSITLFFEAF